MRLGFGTRALALTTVGAFAVASCGGGGTSSGGTAQASPDKQILRVNVDTEPGTLDPVQQQWVYEANVGRNMYEALLRPKGDLSDVEPAAAASYSISSDGLTWTFKLRSDGKFSDGTPVTASDFVFSYKRIFDPTLATSYEPYFEQIAGTSTYSSIDAKNPAAVKAYLDGIGVSALDASTFVIKITSPAPWFKWVVSLWLAGPIKKADVDAVGSANFGAVTAESAAKMHGNGPFMISEVVPKDHITITPNKQYRKQPILQKVIFYYFTDGNVEFAKFQNGELDITRGVPSPDVPVVLADPKLSQQVLRGPTLLNWWIDFNVNKAPLNNVNVRLALAKSIDRDSYITNIRKGIGTAMTTFIPKGERGYEPSDIQKFDCPAAKALIAKAKTEGVTDAQLNSLHYEYAASSARKPGSEFLQQQWQTCLGINVTVDAVESQTHSRNLHNQNYSIGGIQGWQADYPDGQDWFSIFFTGGGNNFPGWSNKQYDELAHKGDNAPNQADRDAAYSQAQKLLLQEAPVMFLYQDEKFLLISSKVKGWTRTALDDDWVGDVATPLTMYIAA